MLPRLKPPPQGIALSTDLLENANIEPLQILIKPYQGITHMPPECGRGDEISLVFVGLQQCHKRAGYVAEGLLGNIIWGFEQSGYQPNAVARGLSELRRMGYIRYTDPLGNPIFETTLDPRNGGTPIWIRYTDKMMGLFVRPDVKAKSPLVSL